MNYCEYQYSDRQKLEEALNLINEKDRASERLTRKTKTATCDLKIRNCKATGGDTNPFGAWKEYWQEVIPQDFPERASALNAGR